MGGTTLCDLDVTARNIEAKPDRVSPRPFENVMMQDGVARSRSAPLIGVRFAFSAPTTR